MRLPGTIVTFYSYKGGVGRTMALANVAWLFAANGWRVLMIDWDLEAPGLHRYFHPFLNDPKLEQSRGLLDLLLDYVMLHQTEPAKRPADITDFMPLANVGRVAIPIDYDFGANGCLHIVGPGLQDDAYAERVQHFDWRTFYRMYDGKQFIDNMAQYIKNQYEIAFIDSRTGVADTSGICTLQMPDTLVLCFTYNRQSMEGTKMIASAVRAQNPPSRILLRPMRVEKDVVGIHAARSYARSLLVPYTGRHIERDFLSYWDAAEVPNYPAYSFEEILAVFGEVAGGRNNLLADMELLAGEIQNTNKPIMMPRLPEAFRQITLSSFRLSEPESKPTPAEVTLLTNDAAFPKSRENQIGLLEEKVKLLEAREVNLVNELRRFIDVYMYQQLSTRDQICIFYGHHDVQLMIQLKTVLAPIIKDKIVNIWDDNMIKPGEPWREQIQAALRSTKVAVLLVSPEFLASEFICTYALPSLLNSERKSGISVLWFPVRNSLVDETPIVEYQAAIDPARPLSSMNIPEQDEAFIHIADAIAAAYHS